MSIIIDNYTPHSVVFYLDDGTTLTLRSKGSARCNVVRALVDSVNNIPVYRSVFGGVTSLPDPVEGKVYVVSRIVAECLKGERDDVFVVDDTVRDGEGRIIGARALAKI